MRFPPIQLFDLNFSAVSRRSSLVIRIIIVQRMIVHTVDIVSGMLRTVFSIVLLFAGSFSVVVVSEVDISVTVEVRLLSISTITVSVLNWNRTNNILAALYV